MDRIRIKERAKSVFRSNYWPLVGLTALLLCAVILSLRLSGDSAFPNSDDLRNYSILSLLKHPSLIKNLSLRFTAPTIFGIALVIFFRNHVEAGHAKISLAAYNGEKYGISDLFYSYTEGRFWNVTGAMALRWLFIVLGLFCLIVPGIIVALGLSQVPYLLARSDDGTGVKIKPMVAVKASWKIMEGHKWELFVFWLSFLGWHILNALTAGILGVFWVNPYYCISKAGYYEALCEKAGV